MNLYDQLGGESELVAIVADFYARVTADELLGPWFAEVDGESLRFHLRAYLTVALGGPERYTGRSMRNVHSGLRITGTAFDAVLSRFGDTLVATGAAEETIKAVDARLQSLRAVVVEIPNN